MKGNSLAVMAWRNLWRNRRRTVLTLSSIVFGVLLAVLFTAMQDQNWADTIDLAARLSGGHVALEHTDYLDAPKLTLTIQNTDRLMEIARTARPPGRRKNLRTGDAIHRGRQLRRRLHRRRSRTRRRDDALGHGGARRGRDVRDEP